MEENVFLPILEKNEEIIKIFKPNKKRMFAAAWFGFMPFTFFAIMIAVIIGANGADAFDGTGFIIGLVCIGVSMIFYIIFTLVLTSVSYKKRYYAYTNKRIIIRTGIIGVDFKSLEYKTLTATSVNVSFIDKMVRQNTGTVAFNSPSSPTYGYSGSTSMSPYSFANIERPYETLKEIKEYIDSLGCE
jgi:hypothetical protein